MVICITLILRDTKGCSAPTCMRSLDERDIPSKFAVSTPESRYSVISPPDRYQIMTTSTLCMV